MTASTPSPRPRRPARTSGVAWPRPERIRHRPSLTTELHHWRTTVPIPTPKSTPPRTVSMTILATTLATTLCLPTARAAEPADDPDAPSLPSLKTPLPVEAPPSDQELMQQQIS